MSDRRLILVVDDSKDDLSLMKHAFGTAQFKASLQDVGGGEAAIAYLNGEDGFSDRTKHPFPSVLLLDLKMPGLDGFEVLRRIKTHPDWRTIYVVVLTSSALPSDVKRSYAEGANAFLVKPTSLAGLVSMMCCLRDWLEYNVLPEPLEKKS